MERTVNPFEAGKTPLTVSQFKALPPRERDALVAVAKGECPHPESEMKYYCIEDGNDVDSGFTCGRCGVDMYAKRCPEYTTDRNAAWKLVDHIKATPRPANALPQAHIAATITDSDEYAACRFDLWRGEVFYCQAETVPLAISCAFMLAMGAIVPDNLQGGE